MTTLFTWNFSYPSMANKNKRPMGHIVHLRSTFVHDKIRPQCLSKEKKYYLFFENWMVLIHLKLNPHHPRMICLKFHSWEDDFQSLSIYFAMSLLSPLGKGMALHLNKRDFPSPKNALCQVGWNLPCASLKFVNIFSLFPYHLPFDKGVALHLNKLQSPSPKDALCQFGWYWPSGS